MTPSRNALYGLAVLIFAGGLSGCREGDDLTVATAWTAAERAGVEAKLRQASGKAWRIRWVLLAPGDDIGRLTGRRTPPDVVLGGPASAYEEGEARGRFEPVEEGGPGWSVARRGSLGIALRDEKDGIAEPGLSFDDPRRDPVALAWAGAMLDSGKWADVYANLVRDAGGARPPGRQTGAALAAFERGETTIALALDPRLRWQTTHRPETASFLADEPADWVEGMAVVKGARHASKARALMRWLARSPDSMSTTLKTSSEARALLADLLGSTLVDAHVELVAARIALDAAGRPARSEMWMTRPPPWPPASVARLLEREKNAMPLLETLAAEIAPEADVRAWLMRSWLSPARQADGALLDELGKAVEGRLARSPRFRAWLRGEWTAWARQRYRRVARQIASRKYEGAPS